jgi:hypothetical protein
VLRIVLSRAALFPWLGVALMAAGAAFPDGNVVGIVLVVIGANVAFYSLRDFSRNFAWGRDARPMLNLCGILFALGLALVAAATRFEPLNRWLAFLCAGLYLCLFAVWTAQQPAGGLFPALAVGGTLLALLGGIAVHIGWPQWRVFAESQPEPQDITLRDLQEGGFGANRHVRIKDFRFCDRSASEKPDRQNRVDVQWVPVVVADGQDVRRDGPAPPVPRRLRAVAGNVPLGNPGVPGLPGRPPRDLLRRKHEEDGYECTVVTGINKLEPEVRQQLAELAPETDFDELTILDWRKPAPAESAYGWLGGGGAAFLLGLAALGVVYVRARKAVAAEGWGVPTDEPADQPCG